MRAPRILTDHHGFFHQAHDCWAGLDIGVDSPGLDVNPAQQYRYLQTSAESMERTSMRHCRNIGLCRALDRTSRLSERSQNRSIVGRNKCEQGKDTHNTLSRYAADDVAPLLYLAPDVVASNREYNDDDRRLRGSPVDERQALHRVVSTLFDRLRGKKSRMSP